jgi:hypothetical protein
MAITIQIPPDIERELRRKDPQLDIKTRDLFLVSNYQSGKLSTGDIADILGFDTRFQAEEWLAAHGANQNYSLDDLESDRQTLDRILGPVNR